LRSSASPTFASAHRLFFLRHSAVFAPCWEPFVHWGVVASGTSLSPAPPHRCTK
jgi:hypothetical protein